MHVVADGLVGAASLVPAVIVGVAVPASAGDGMWFRTVGVGTVDGAGTGSGGDVTDRIIGVGDAERFRSDCGVVV